MKISDVVTILKAEVYCGETLLETEIKSGCGCDMMSDVLAYVKEQSVLLTGLVNPQSIRTAIMMDMKCVVFVRGKIPDEKIVKLAVDNDIVVLASEYRMFVACGLLYSNGLKGGE